MPLGFITDEAQVNTTTAGNQRAPASAQVATGYVTVWASDNGDGSGKAIMGQLFAANGTKIGAEFVVNSTTAGNQDLPDVITVHPDGFNNVARGFFVVWQSEEATGTVIRGRRFLADGTPAPFAPNGSTDDAVISGAEGGSKPSVGALTGADGGTQRFGVVYEAPSGDGSGTAIMLARYQPRNGLGTTGVERVNSTADGDQRDPRIMLANLGVSMIVWESQESGGDVIRARAATTQGLGAADYVVSSAVGQDESLPEVVRIPESGVSPTRFMAIWNEGTNVMARGIDSVGPVGSAFVLNSTPGGVVSRSDIVGLPVSGYMVAYFTQAGDDGSSYSIRAERFNYEHAPQSAEFFVPQSFAGAQEAPNLIVLEHGNIVVTWASEADELGNFEIRQRLLNLDAPSGTEASETINGTIADDVLNGLGGNDTINGLGGNDTIDGGTGNDVMDGGDGIDTVTYASSTVPVTISLANTDPQDNGDTGSDTLINFENLTGSPFADILYGDDGANVIDGGAGGDTMTGGDGNDVYHVDDAAGDLIVELAGEGVDEVRTALASYTLTGGVENLTATNSAAHEFRGNSANNVINGFHGNDFFWLQDGGNDTALGHLGKDSFYFGAAYTADDVVGGSSDRDQMALQGNYALTLGTITDVEDLILLSGTDTRFGDPGTGLYSYAITSIDANVAAGATLLVDGTQLVAGESFTFNGAAETDGKFILAGGNGVDTLTGGAGADGFYFRAGTFWGSGDTVTGGASDQIGFRGDFTGANKVVMGADQIVGVTTLVMMSGTDTRFGPAVAPTKFDIQMHDFNVGAGATFTVDGNFLTSAETMRIDASLETNGAYRLFGGAGADELIGGAGADQLTGGLGQDLLKGGGGADTFVYRNAADSTSTGYDRIDGFAFGSDLLDLPGSHDSYGHIAGTLNSATFDADLAAAMADLFPTHARFLTVTGGDLAGRVFLVVDQNGTQGYQAGADFVFEFINTTVPGPPIPDFIV